jgi:hypothetical protein
MRRAIVVLVAALAARLSFASDLLDCVYVDDGPRAELELHAQCARRIPDGVSVLKSHLARMSFRDGFASVLIEHQHYYVKRDGSILPVLTFDNGADYFAEGLVRSLVDGKIAYYNADFEQVIAPRFDWGSPFRNGRALVCRGCKNPPPSGDEHASMVGGLWGWIDRKGNEVVPVSLSLTEAQLKE